MQLNPYLAFDGQCREAFQFYEQTLGGKIVLITAAFKAHAAINFWRGQELRGDGANADAMGQFGKIASASATPTFIGPPFGPPVIAISPDSA